ncbi:short-chain dehydrogenase/reductase 2b-like [Vigna unguiculata]|uniref:short-chain dehydrogenase/reductase 2b-like n=1 Tax=Vigna unguiculata TaxID=3917 RepID=UPI0010162E1C|nr:short-chain dehydrogenase/reductase 2b-like [Vigna unguiculata]
MTQADIFNRQYTGWNTSALQVLEKLFPKDCRRLPGFSPSKVNNAGIGGVVIKTVFNQYSNPESWDEQETKTVTQTYELAKECLQINYYGTKITVESLMPLLQLSDSPTIVNLSSFIGQLEELEEDVFDILALWATLFSETLENEIKKTAELLSRI